MWILWVAFLIMLTTIFLQRNALENCDTDQAFNDGMKQGYEAAKREDDQEELEETIVTVYNMNKVYGDSVCSDTLHAGWLDTVKSVVVFKGFAK